MIPLPAQYNYPLNAAKGRLRYYKDYAEAMSKRHPSEGGGANWRGVRQYVSVPVIRPRLGGSWSKDREKYYCNEIPSGCREVGTAEDILRLRHTGWYTDTEGRGLCYGIVIQYPARNGCPRYYPGIEYKDEDCIILFLKQSYEDKEEAAREADECARLEGEERREADEEELAQALMGTAHDTISGARRQCLGLLMELRKIRCTKEGNKYTEPFRHNQIHIFEACLYQVRRYLNTIRKARKEIKDLKEQYPHLFN